MKKIKEVGYALIFVTDKSIGDIEKGLNEFMEIYSTRVHKSYILQMDREQREKIYNELWK